MKSNIQRNARFRSGRIAVVLAGGMLAAIAAEKPVSATESADPAERAACADAYRNGQVQRKSGALRKSRESLLACVSDRCPAMLQPDCTRWLTEVEAAIPSLTFAAKGPDGKDVAAVRVSVDGQVLTEMLDGKSLPIDPGSHALRFQYGSEPPIEQTIVVREGEKARVVSVSWAPAGAEHEASGHGPGAPSSKNTRMAAWISGAVGVAALGTFGALAVDGTQRRSNLEKQCFGTCEQRQVDSIKTEFAIADLALGAGVVALGISTVLFLSSSSAEKRSAASDPRQLSWTAAPTKSGGAVGLGGRF